MTTAPSVITTATRILRPSGGCRAPAWTTDPAVRTSTSESMSTSASMSTANITRIMGHPFFRLLTRVVLLAFAEETKNAQFLPAWMLVAPVWMEQTTCRLQGGWSLTELRRRRSGLYATSPIFRAHPILPGVYLDEPHRFGACKSEARS